MARQKGLFLANIILLLEAIAIFISAGGKTTGQAIGILNKDFSNVTVILIIIFIVTLFSILLSVKLIRDAHRNFAENKETKLSKAIVTKSFEEHKTKNQIEKELVNSGYKKNEIEEFFKSWEHDEEHAVSAERKM